MNIKSPISLVAMTTLLYGCMSTGNYQRDEAYFAEVPMSRDFIMDSYDRSAVVVSSEGNHKINTIKPTGDTEPRAVILLENRILPSSWWKLKDYNFTVRKKNIELCKGFMKLQRVDDLEREGVETGDILKSNRKNHVITYMPAKGTNRNNLPSNTDDCQTFVESGYDYQSAAEELSFIFKGEKLGKSPYVAVYESPSNPYTSMILSIGDLSPEAISVLSSKWPELIMKVYQRGDNLDPQLGVAVMLANDPSLQMAQKDAMWKNIKITFKGAVCTGILASSTVSLTTLMATPSCQGAIEETKDALGYS